MDSMNKTFKVKIEAFRAIDNLDKCRAYLEGHRRILIDHGFTHFNTNNSVWMYNPNVYVFLVSDYLNQNIPLGGVRFHLKTDGIPLPFENVLLDKNIDFDLEQKYRNRRCGELCGLWNSKLASGLSISHLISFSGYAFLSKLSIDECFIFNAKYTFPITNKLGFSLVDSIGSNGHIPYPNEYFKAYVWSRMIGTYDDMDDKVRTLVQSLEFFPCQVKTIKWTKRIEAYYDLATE